MAVAVKRSLKERIEKELKEHPPLEVKAYLAHEGENEREVSMIIRHLIKKRRRSHSFGKQMEQTSASIQLGAFPKQYRRNIPAVKKVPDLSQREKSFRDRPLFDQFIHLIVVVFRVLFSK